MKKILVYIIIPVFLLLFWLISTIQLVKSTGFSILEYGEPKTAIISGVEGKMVKGDKITGEFKAHENHLGIVVIGFKDFTRYSYDGEDILSFKLKEKNSNDWYFEGGFRSGLLENNLKFPIGFPIIADSKDKTYLFEILSLNGNQNNGVAFDKNDSSISTRYQFPAEIVKSSNSSIYTFGIKKIKTLMQNPSFMINSALYLLPLFLYLFALYIRRFKNAEKFYIFILSVLILADIFYIQEINLPVIFGLVLGWIITIKQYDISYKFTFLYAFIGIFIWAILAPLEINRILDKINLWVYIFLLIGMFQIILGEKKIFKKK